MLQVSNEELTKITQFIAGCNDMIKGKFILADIKISKLLNMIAQSSELYNFIKDSMYDFDFSREYHRAVIKNRINNGEFVVPNSQNTLIAFVFCLLVECDAKRLDFYGFINENFPAQSKTESYNTFAEKLLVPFRDIISAHFNFEDGANDKLQTLTQSYKQDLQAEPIFDSYQNIQNQQELNNYQNDYQQNNKNAYEFSQYNQNNFIYTQTNNNPNNYVVDYEEKIVNTPPPVKLPLEEKDVWQDIKSICDNIISSVYTERKLKGYLKEELLYILNTIKYSVKYKDAKIVSALVTAFDEMSKKYRSIQFVFNELKSKIEELY